jgi:Zn-dependent protease with chaperone function
MGSPDNFFEANYHSHLGDPGTKIHVEQLEGGLHFRVNGENKNWSLSQIRVEKIQGSADKWYIRNSENRFPLLYCYAGIPGITTKADGTLLKKSNSSVFKVLGGLFLAFLVGLFFLFSFVYPAVTDWIAQEISLDWEKSNLSTIKTEVLKNSSVDQKRTKLLRKIMAGMKFPAGADGKVIRPEFYVINESSFNAFAIPGAVVFVHSGAIDDIESLPELLALLGHENGHVIERHAIRSLVRSVGLYAIVGFFIGDVGALSAVIFQNAETLQNLSYSRDFEREADAAAFEFLCINGANTAGITDLMKRMLSKEKKGRGSPVFLKSHPPTEERLEEAKKIIKENNCKQGMTHLNEEALFLELKARH